MTLIGIIITPATDHLIIIVVSNCDEKSECVALSKCRIIAAPPLWIEPFKVLPIFMNINSVKLHVISISPIPSVSHPKIRAILHKTVVLRKTVNGN